MNVCFEGHVKRAPVPDDRSRFPKTPNDLRNFVILSLKSYV